MTTGMMATPRELIELSQSLKAPAWREFTQIRIPYAIPYIFSGLKISITLAVIGAVVAEFVASSQGLGFFIQFSTSNFKLPQAWLGLGLLVLMSLTLFNLWCWCNASSSPGRSPRMSGDSFLIQGAEGILTGQLGEDARASGHPRARWQDRCDRRPVCPARRRNRRCVRLCGDTGSGEQPITIFSKAF
jgi:hypothetical protein